MTSIHEATVINKETLILASKAINKLNVKRTIGLVSKDGETAQNYLMGKLRKTNIIDRLFEVKIPEAEQNDQKKVLKHVSTNVDSI